MIQYQFLYLNLKIRVFPLMMHCLPTHTVTSFILTTTERIHFYYFFHFLRLSCKDTISPFFRLVSRSIPIHLFFISLKFMKNSETRIVFHREKHINWLFDIKWPALKTSNIHTPNTMQTEEDIFKEIHIHAYNTHIYIFTYMCTHVYIYIPKYKCTCIHICM